MNWHPINLTAPEFSRPTEPPIICDLFYRGKRHALSGPPEAAKTLVALTAGLTWQRNRHGRFAFLDFEQDEASIRLMLEELGATKAEIANVYYVAPEGPPDEEDIRALLAANVTLTAIDAAAGAYDASGLDDNKRADTERFARLWITPLWRHGITTILLDHVVKNIDARGRYAIGSERKLGQVDVHLGLEAIRQLSRGGHGLVRVTVHKDRPGHLHRPHPCELHLESHPETNKIMVEFQTAKTAQDVDTDLPPAARKLLEALQAQTGPATASQLVDWIARTYGHGLRRETVSRELNKLKRDGAARCLNEDAEIATPRLWERA